MATTGANAIFLDTNVLVYAVISRAPLHVEARRAIRQQQQAGLQLWTSRQVLREYLATLTRPQTFTLPLATEILVSDLRHFQRHFSIAEDDKLVTETLLRLMSDATVGGKQVHDANIVATMLVRGIPAILTHNVADYVRFSGLITVVPLVS